MSENKSLELCDPSAPGFVDRVTPKKPDALMLLKCQRPTGPEPVTAEPDYPDNLDLGPYRTPAKPQRPVCGGSHFRHAGYMHTMLPFMRANQEKKVELAQYQVMVCVKCRASYVWAYDQLYDVSDQVDLEAWEKLERDAHKATGPGGQC